ncbi:MAG: hypothetical protein Q8L14_23400 [Myxococcales bacterium]|nr:hypothetical protein [Myxococcales bacterium]
MASDPNLAVCEHLGERLADLQTELRRVRALLAAEGEGPELAAVEAEVEALRASVQHAKQERTKLERELRPLRAALDRRVKH